MNNDIDDTVEDLLGEQGVFAQCIEGFQVREQQKRMVAEIMRAIQTSRHLTVIEAGTGVGKTFAYLAPALSVGKQVLISTGSKTLQDQLYFKDLPIVRKALHKPLKSALLKGRANYLCIHRLSHTLQDGRFSDRHFVTWLRRIEDWSGVTKNGDIAECSVVPSEAGIWPYVTSSIDNCVGRECDHYQECYVVKARRKAQEADVVVVNHHLFFADMALKESGFGDLLPNFDVVILDEAHQLPDIASTFFSETITSRKLMHWKRDTYAEVLINAPDMRQLRDELQCFEKIIAEFRYAMDTPGQRAPWDNLRDKPAITRHLTALIDSTEVLITQLSLATERSKGLEASYEHLLVYQQQLRQMQTSQENRVQWYETYTNGFALTSTPLDIATPLCKTMQELPCSWILTSATLAVGDSFEHFMTRLGLNDATTLRLDSPFDYWHHSLLYLPSDLPEPQQFDFIEHLVEAAIPVIHACGGRTFMLFTSYRALNEAAERLADRVDFPILVQGESSQHDMIERFKALGNAVLLGTSTFWEGVDVRGEALSCVIIDKLPFAAPNDPVMEARMDAIRRRGGSPFTEYQLPQAVIALKQGVGRLIRDHHDKGVLMICDVRLRARRYGQVFLDSLPRMPRTQKLDVVERFFTHHENSST